MYFQTAQVIFVPEWPKGEFASILGLFCVWTKSLMCKDAEIGIPLSEWCQSILPASRKNFKFPVSHSDDRAIPSGRPHVHCSISSDDVSFRLDAIQSRIIRLDDMLLPSGLYTVSRSFCSSLFHLDVSAIRPDAYQLSNGSLILSKFQEREDQSIVWTMWYPVQTRVPIRQESQFKLTIRTSDSCGPDASASYMVTANSTSTVRTSTPHSPGARTSDMEIAC